MSDTCIEHIEKVWKSKTNSGNDFFNAANLTDALWSYELALYQSEVLNNNYVECLRLKIPFIQIYIISCNNIANTYVDMGDTEQADKMFKRVIHFLLHISARKELDANEIQNELKLATLAYVCFSEKNYQGDKEQEELFTTVKEQLVENRLIKIE
jgi:tetratricopeptide (TPR) repeat protein